MNYCTYRNLWIVAILAPPPGLCSPFYAEGTGRACTCWSSRNHRNLEKLQTRAYFPGTNDLTALIVNNYV